MKRKIKSFFEPYGVIVGTLYLLGIIILIILTRYFVIFKGDVDDINSILPYLGQLMGGAFAFIFSIGVYSTTRNEKIITTKIPLFNKRMLLYFLLFTSSIIFPFIIYFSNFESLIFQYYVIVCFSLLIICLAFIPLAFISIRNRYDPENVLKALGEKALNNIKTSNDYYASWRYITEISRICNILFIDDIEMFALGIRCLRAILIRGFENSKNEKVMFQNKEIPVKKWNEKVEKRIYWIGEVVVDNPRAFQRVIDELVEHEKLMKEMRPSVDSIVFKLCNHADRKGKKESLDIALEYPVVREIYLSSSSL